MKKNISFIIIIMLIFTTLGCVNKGGEVGTNFFEIQKATKLCEDYMRELSLGNIDEANKMVDDKLQNKNEFEKIKENKITSYKLDEVEEGANHAFFKYLVIRGKDDKSRVDLDDISIKVSKKNEHYMVEEIKAKNKKQVYKEKFLLRIKDEETGKSEVLVRKKDLPREIYPKRDEVVLEKESVSVEDFDKLAIGFSGNSVGITTKGNDKTFIALATVREDKETVGEVSSDENIEEAIDDALEKPIVNKLIDYDLLDKCDVEKILFSTDDGEMIVQVKEAEKASKVRIYKNPTGELLKLQLNSLFPEDKYSVEVECVNKEGVFINVTSIADKNERVGKYKIDLKEMKVNKM